VSAQKEKPASPSTDRALTVLETLVETDMPLTLTGLAKEAGVPLATCAAIVQTLEERGYAQRQVVGRSHFWRPTLRLYGLASGLVRKLDLVRVTQPHLRTLSEAVGMPAHLGVLDGASIVYVAKAATPGFIQFDTFVGKVAPYNLTALGKAIAAHLPEAQLGPLLDRLAKGAGPHAQRPSRKALTEELAQIREQGFAVEDEEEQAEIACIAAPVFDASSAVAYSVGITGFAREVMREKYDLALSAVLRAAKSISAELGGA
jgi:IclR family KDG regulon transcriptional repressor